MSPTFMRKSPSNIALLTALILFGVLLAMVITSALHGSASRSGPQYAVVDTSFDKKLKAWLGRIVSQESPSNEVIAYNIGLFETPQGYTAYLCGARKYSAEDGDWATEEAFTPRERYFPFPPVMKVMKWEQAQKVTINVVRTFLAENPNSFLAKAKAVTVGFDDGDLVPVK
jgi:hypothetical protein